MIVDAEKAVTIYLQKTYQHMIPEERCGKARWKVERETRTERESERAIDSGGAMSKSSTVVAVQSGGGGSAT